MCSSIYSIGSSEPACSEMIRLFSYVILNDDQVFKSRVKFGSCCCCCFCCFCCCCCCCCCLTFCFGVCFLYWRVEIGSNVPLQTSNFSWAEIGNANYLKHWIFLVNIAFVRHVKSLTYNAHWRYWNQNNHQEWRVVEMFGILYFLQLGLYTFCN